MDMRNIVDHQQILEIAKRDQCGSKTTDNEDYNLGLHIFALFLILTCGTLACSFPVLVKAFPKLGISKHVLFISRHFGTGVLIALGFAHLLPTAFESLWDECLPESWTEGYDAMPGVIAMVAALAVMVVEMAFSAYGVKHTHAVEDVESREEDDQADPSAQTPKDVNGHTVTPIPQPEPTISKQKEQRMILQCLLLEAGILFHSVFIGLSISLSTGTTFIALMIAISFHQIFEGLALGARIAATPSLRVSSWKPWIMSFAYGLTCPLGQAIGLGLRDTYDEESTTALLVVGIANAISAGMILYAGLVQLLAEDLLSEESYKKLSTCSRIEATLATLLGCALMSLLAIWA